MEVINKDIIYKVEVDDLTADISYTAKLWDKASGTVVSATATPTTTTPLATFTFSTTQTGMFDEGAILTFEIYDTEDKKAIYYKDRFARVRDTSVTKDESSNS